MSWDLDSMKLASPWASLVVQLVKNPPAMQETLDRFLGQKDPLEKGMATEFRMPLVLAQGSPIFHSSCEGKLGIALE